MGYIMEIVVLASIFAFGIIAGSLGAMLGLGGGVLMILFFILVLDIPAHEAVALSLLAVIASSSVGGSIYVRDKLTNVRLAMVLETCTVTGAVLGALVALSLPVTAIQVILGGVLLYTSITMIKGIKSETVVCDTKEMTVKGEYYDTCNKTKVNYCAVRMKFGLLLSIISGTISGIIGIGGGVIMVPIMNLAMKIPIKAAAATSNFMVGVTAAASAFIYFNEGLIDAYLSVPTVLGIMLGAYFGTRLLFRTQSSTLRKVLAAVLVFFGIVLFLKAGGIVNW